MNEPPCKGCMASVRLTASELERLIAEYGEQENEPLATTADSGVLANAANVQR
ncbi:hypothetical protein P5F80_17400 [Shouchella clausii]|uniref:hypothetical protein n=1 Tax=Shouchella clausii TaxID=79880 RepID=UPI0020B3ED11|nr:hypothetical protein [Shouchella clausii]MCY1104067.1 hypothetical protein [Shouchella clausii]MED4160059.1 hypothetical protein [Shouchella clausii]MED4178306.1 hypothetical protein [Shouchella clausii]